MQKSRVQRIWENAVVFYLGGMFYCTVELLWRQWTHGSMFLLGGQQPRAARAYAAAGADGAGRVHRDVF